MRAAMIDYGVRILILSAVISIFTAFLLFLAVRHLLVKPIRGVVVTCKATRPRQKTRGASSPRTPV